MAAVVNIDYFVNGGVLTPAVIAALMAATPSTGKFTTLEATGAVTLDSTLHAVGAVTFDDALTVATTLGVTGLSTLTASAKIDTGTKVAVASSGAATLAKYSGVITTEALTTAAGATYVLDITNSVVAATDQVFAFVRVGSSTTGMPVLTTCDANTGHILITVQNIHASAALNGTLEIGFVVFKA